MLRICRVLVSKRNPVLCQLSGTQCRLRRLAVSLECGTGVHQQLHQSFHLRRQVPRVPTGSQKSDVEAESESTAHSSCRNHLKVTVVSSASQLLLMLFHVAIHMHEIDS